MIDIKTFMLALAVGNIGFAVLMAGYARTGTGNAAINVWKWAKLVQGCAHLMGWLQPMTPGSWLSVASTSALILGMALDVAAYCTFFGFTRWRRLLYPFAALGILVFQGARLSGMPGNDVTVIMSCILSLLSGAMAYILLRPAARGSLLQRLIGINDLLFFVAMGARAYAGAVHGGITLFSPGVVQTFTYLAGFLLMIVNGFGFLLLCKEKDDQHMARLATVDSLTGLVNRRAFFEQTEAARAIAARLRKPIALMMMDIDHFKRINDRLGHAGGDEALCVFSRAAQGVLRDQDILGRLGGEEFALVLPCTDITGALQVAERLRNAVESAALTVDGDGARMTVSIGVAQIDSDEHINAALARADHALYAAKSSGRNRVEVGRAGELNRPAALEAKVSAGEVMVSAGGISEVRCHAA